MAFTKNSAYVFTIISNKVSVEDISDICDTCARGINVSIVIYHTDRNFFDHFSGIKRSTLSTGDTIARTNKVVIHFINAKTKAEFKVPLRRDSKGNIIWEWYIHE